MVPYYWYYCSFWNVGLGLVVDHPVVLPRSNPILEAILPIPWFLVPWDWYY